MNTRITKALLLNALLACVLIFPGILPVTDASQKKKPSYELLQNPFCGTSAYMSSEYFHSSLTPYASSFGLTDCMDGDTLLRCVFVESDGTIDPNLYSWNNPSDPKNPYGTQEIDTYVQKIKSELDFTWSLWAPRYGKQARFFVEKNTVTIGYEPILHTSSDVAWMRAAMSKILGTSVSDGGVAADQWAQSGLTVNQFGRSFNHAAVIFFMMNQSETEGHFSYATMGGPYAVLKRINYTNFSLETTTAHEVGHLFWAQDEDTGSCSLSFQSTCTTPWPGQERRTCVTNLSTLANGNCVDCPEQHEDCLMLQLAPLICQYTARHVGWTAAALTPPKVTNAKCLGCTTGGNLVIRGTGFDSSCKVLIDRVEYPTIYRATTQDFAVKNMFLQPGRFYEFRVKRYSDGLTSDGFRKAF